MAVELAVVLPVAIAVGLIVFNLMRFVSVCARFDRVSLDAVVSQGVSPSGEQTELVSIQSVQDCIESALDEEDVTVNVRAEPSGETGSGQTFVIAPNLTRFVCTLEVRPWPSSFSMAGVSWTAPVVLRHERSLVVDRYRPGVVI